MAVIEFLQQQLAVLAAQFPNIQIRYAYNPTIATHTVELTPETQYYNNPDLNAAWVPISIRFMETFLAEDICFVSSDSRLAVTEAEFEWQNGELVQQVACAEFS